MAAVDDGVQKIGQFCAVLAATVTRLQGDTSTLEQHGAGVERLGEGLQDSFTALEEQLRGFDDGLAAAESGAASEVERVDEAARGHAGDDLPELEQRVDGEEDGFEQNVEDGRGDLDAGFSDLGSSGFDALAATMDEVEQGLEAAASEGEQALAQLESELEGLGQEFDAARADAAQALDDAAARLSGEEAPALTGDGESCAAGWSEELPALVAAESGAIGDPVAAQYEGFGEDAVADGDDLMEAVSDAAGEAASLLEGEVATDLAAAAGLVVDEAMGALSTECDEAAAVLEVGAALADALPALAADLAVARTVVAEVDELLAALG
jgi:hypothetical protein